VTRLLAAILVLAALAVGLVALGQQGIGPVLVTREDQQRILLLLGDPRDEHTEPGVSLRLPVLEEVRTYDSRWLHLASDPKEIQTTDRERIVVDHYVIWRIADPLQFYKSFPTGPAEAETQIGQQVRAKVREVIGQHKLVQVLKDQRAEIMEEIGQKSGAVLERFGIEVNDVRINRTELPKKTEANVYARMRAERERQARKNRAEGEERARRIRAEADRGARVIVAEARGQAEIERGKGDAESTRTYAEAYSKDAEFYGFLRGLEAYRKTIGEGTTMILAPDHEFFRLLSLGSEGGSPGSSESRESSE
jgi:membrane protease subunit HflC